MKNILLSLFVLSCLTVNIAYAEKTQTDNKVKPKPTYEQNDSEDEYEGAFKAGSPAGVDAGLTTDHNKTNEAVNDAKLLKETENVFEGSNDEDIDDIEDIEAGEEANKKEQEQALKKMDEDLMEVDKQIIKKEEKKEASPCKEAKAPAKK